MSVSKRVSEAIEKMDIPDAEAALFAICAPLEATAVKEFGKRGRASYKDFISHNLGLITSIAFGSQVLNLNLAFNHPDLKPTSDGLHSIQDIVYHAVRCGLYHEASLPSNLRFADDSKIVCDNGVLTLPASLLYGFIIAVVVSPVNAHELADKPHFLSLGGFPIPISRLWGRRTELLWLLDAVAESRRMNTKPNTP